MRWGPLSVLVAWVSMLLVPDPGTSQWQIWRVDSIGDVGLYTSIEVGHNNFPCISYYDETKGDLRYAYYDGSIWVIDTVDASVDVGTYSSLDMDSQDFPHVAYLDRANGDLKYACWDGVNWTVISVDTGNVIEAYCSLALEPITDYPHISYCKNGNLWHAWRDGAAWRTEVVDAAPWTGYDSSIDLDPTNNDYPCISYIDNWNGWVRYAYWTGVTWEFETPDDTPSPTYSSLDVGPNGVAHVAYSHLDPTPPFPRELRYAWRSGLGTWSTEAVPYPPCPSYGSFPSIAVNIYFDPRISFSDEVAGDLLYASKVGTWATNIVDYMDRVGLYTSLVLRNGVDPCISYYDETNGDLKCACTLVGVCDNRRSQLPRTTDQLLQNRPNPFTTSTCIRYAVSADGGPRTAVRLSIYDVSGRLVRTLVDRPSNHATIEPSNQVIWDGNDESGRRVPSGVYFSRLTTGDFAATTKMLVVR